MFDMHFRNPELRLPVPICEKRFPWPRRLLQMWRKSHTTDDPWRVTCDNCRKSENMEPWLDLIAKTGDDIPDTHEVFGIVFAVNKVSNINLELRHDQWDISGVGQNIWEARERLIDNAASLFSVLQGQRGATGEMAAFLERARCKHSFGFGKSMGYYDAIRRREFSLLGQAKMKMNDEEYNGYWSGYMRGYTRGEEQLKWYSGWYDGS